ncbi:hypothetical protein BZL54_25155 [Burkholderia ubonensis subsp. mesacidophila]|uniref:Uncharacterized protein n=2 Tax=Burkholderia ubonensis TaxID=101571 RepID=A0A2A4FA48_9BURK|nr:hypothetical protein BZL54_25155 [Burkholderia ubonensis subsp. mesacidophila]
MIPTFVRLALRCALWCVTIATALFIALLIVIVVARYETDEGTCPDWSADSVRVKVLTFLAERHVQLTGVRFEGQPEYYPDSTGWWTPLGWWGLRLNRRDGPMIATVDCNGRVSYATVESPSVGPHRHSE